MKRTIIVIALLVAGALCANAQMEIKPNGKVVVGPGRASDDQDNVLTMSLFGQNGEYRAGSKLAFGDFGMKSYNGWNVFIGEWADDDTDILWLHGKNGIRMTSWDASSLLGEWDIYEGNKGFTVYDGFRADRIAVSSDDSYKTNVSNIPWALARVLQLNGKIYVYDQIDHSLGEGDNLSRGDTDDVAGMTGKDSVSIRNLERELLERGTRGTLRYGLLASELLVQFPELVDTDAAGNQYINYIEMVPILVTAINDLYAFVVSRTGSGSSALDSVAIGEQEERGAKSGVPMAIADDKTAKLYQNTPNPFSEETAIEYYVPTDAKSASLYVFNLTGEMLQSLPISSFGHGSVTISGSTLQAGMYVYSLVVDGQMVGTKRMILTK